MSEIKIIIKAELQAKNLPVHIADRVRADLTYDNPTYLNAKKHGLWISSKTPSHLYYYSTRGSNTFFLPKGYMRTLLMYLKGMEYEIIDRSTKPFADLEFTGKLREYQEAAFAKCIEKRFGVLEADTGSGKTVTGIAIACHHKTRTLVIVHNKELQQQWIERIKQYTNVEKVGTIGGGGKPKLQDFTVGIVNSVHNMREKLAGEFGFLILDECHRAIGDTWVRAVNASWHHSHLGLSATPWRRDGLTPALFKVVGPRLHKVNRQQLVDEKAVLVPAVIKVNTYFRINRDEDDEQVPYSSIIKKLVTSAERNQVIVDAVVEDLKKYNEPVMIVSDRVSHCEELDTHLVWREGIKPVVLHSKLSKDERRERVEQVRSGEANTIIATASLLGEGFDAPDLSAIFLTTPMRFSGRLIQVIGRILRPSSQNQPRVYDFVDYFIRPLRYSSFARDKVYAERGWE